MKTQTPIQLLKESIDYEMKLGTKMVVNWDWYLEMEKEMIIKAYNSAIPFHFGEQYYNETFNTKEK